MRPLRLILALCFHTALFACDKASLTSLDTPMHDDLAPGGVYVVYNHGCIAGCDRVRKGDLIQTLDGTPVTTPGELEGLTDGQPHALEFLRGGTHQTVTIQAKPKSNMPPLRNVPPFWLVSAKALDQAPVWARRRMFAHASPSLMLVDIEGGIIDGRQLYGTKRFMVYWDWGDRVEEAAAVDFMQVLQKAQSDLAARGIATMFVHASFPTSRKAPMNDSDLRAWQRRWTVREGDQPLAPIPFYRFPNATEFNPARELGMENAFTAFENLGQSPAIVLLDERGIVRWHSEGIEDPAAIGSAVADPEQATIIAAIEFALSQL